MEEIKLDKDNKIIALQKAIEVLNEGGVIVYPTETSYGLGCDFYNLAARDKIYDIKQRDKNNPLPVIVPDMVAASYLVDFLDAARRLALEYWPGPLTLVLPYKYCKIQKHCDDYLALRVSSHPFARELATNFGKPIVATSANLSGQDNAYSGDDVRKHFKNLKIKPDLFIDAGQLPKRNSSTIVKFSQGQGEVLRQGDLKIKI